jgi:hypothetical protein
MAGNVPMLQVSMECSVCSWNVETASSKAPLDKVRRRRDLSDPGSSQDCWLANRPSSLPICCRVAFGLAILVVL